MIKYFVSPVLKGWLQSDNGTQHTISSIWDNHLRKDPEGKRIIVCADLVIGGSFRIRTAMKLVDIQDGAKRYCFEGTMVSAPNISHDVDPSGNSASSLRSMSFDVVADVDLLSSIIAKGHIIAGFGEIFLIADGMSYQDRFVVLRGEMLSGLTLGGKGEPISITLSDPSYAQEVIIPPYTIKENSFEGVILQPFTGNSVPITVHEAAVGARYPLVLSSNIAVPLIELSVSDENDTVFQVRWYVVCYGHDVDVKSVWIDGVQIFMGDIGITLQQVSDASGRPVTIVGLDGFSSLFDLQSVQNVHADVVYLGESRSILQTMKYLLENYSRVGIYGIQHSYFAMSSAKMPSYISATILINASGGNETATAITYMESTLGTEFPMLKFFWYGDGYAVTVCDRTRNPYVGYFVVGQHPFISRYSSVTEEAVGDSYNSFSIRYGYNAHLQSFSGVVLRNPSNNMFCKMSEEVVGLKEADTLDAVIIPDAVTANYVLDWMCAHNTLPSYRVSYSCHNWVMFNLRLGDNIYITDSGLNWTQVQATIVGITYQQTHCIVQLCVWLLYDNLSGGAVSSFGVSIGGIIGE